MRTAHKWKTAAGAVIAGAALIATTACSSASDTARAQDVRAGSVTPGFGRGLNQVGTTPILVTCEPDQRTLVRQTVVNGETVAQVECVRAGVVANTGYVSYPPAYGPATAVPVSYPAAAYPAATYPAPQATPAVLTYPAPAPRARTARSQRVVYERARSGRSWKKSAIIVGSSAGIGAGVGAAVGGKKGALIGAAVGGGSAAIWDQVTRR